MIDCFITEIVAAASAAEITAQQNALDSFCNANNCCNGSDACAVDSWDLAYEHTICPNSCSGNKACYRHKGLGNYYIGENACTNGSNACVRINNGGQGSVTVNAGSCQGDNSCNGLGARSTGNIVIETNECIGNDSCNACGKDHTGAIVASGGECILA